MSVINKINAIFSDNAENGGIILSTIHKSKGLEADRVFIIHSELMPSKFAKKAWERTQEKNLIYVAYTRAKSVLGFVSDFNAYEKGSSEERVKVKESEYMGEIGSKLPLELEVVSVKTILNTAYGDATVFDMKDSEGNLYSKMGVIPERFIVSNHSNIEAGTMLKFNGTVKQHREFKGVKYTVISTVSKYKA